MSKKLLCVVMAIIFMVSTVVSVSVSADMQPMTEYSTDDEFSSDVEESTEEDVSDFVNEKWDNYGVLSYHLRIDGTVEITGCNQDVNSVEIPSEIEGYPVISISDWAFSYNDSLEDITIGKSVKNIGYSAFAGCTHVKRIVWNAKNIESVPYNSFYNVGTESQGIDLIFSDSVNTIPSYIWGKFDPDIFSDPGEPSNINVKSVTIGKNVKKINPYAFYVNGNDVSFESLYIEDISSWVSINYYSNPLVYAKIKNVYIEDKLPKNITIPEGITKINNCAFYGLISIENVILPETLQTIGGSAFYGCSGITSVIFPEGLMVIEDSAFAKCNNLKEITISETVTDIGSSAFAECPNLSRIFWNAKNAKNFTEYFEYFYGGIFWSYDGITGSNTDGIEIVFGDSVETIDDHTFLGCKLKDVIIPDSVISIGERSFCYCPDYFTITIPDSVKHIGYKMIDDKDTQTVYYKGSKAQWDEITFGSESQPWEIKNAVVHYNAGDQKHEQFVLPALEATCTETGLTEGLGCSGCEMFFKEQTVIPAKGHIDEDADNICDVCDEVLSSQTPDTDDGGERGENNSSDGISLFFASIKELFNRIISWFRTIFGMV